MAIYHCSIKIISRGKGKSAVAAAAYRAGELIKNEYDGITHDYTRKGGVVYISQAALLQFGLTQQILRRIVGVGDCALGSVYARAGDLGNGKHFTIYAVFQRECLHCYPFLLIHFPSPCVFPLLSQEDLLATQYCHPIRINAYAYQITVSCEVGI